jgi:two-component sensor histidine kinase
VSGLSMTGETNLRCELASGCLLPSEKAALLGLLTGELVTNAVKYAHPAGVSGIIKIKSSSCDDGAIEIVVSDDGVGLPDGLDPLVSKGMGFRMIQALTSQAGATISFDNHGLGLTCTLRVPCADWNPDRFRKVC